MQCSAVCRPGGGEQPLEEHVQGDREMAMQCSAVQCVQCSTVYVRTDAVQCSADEMAAGAGNGNAMQCSVQCAVQYSLRA